MPTEETADVSRQEFSIAYDGPAGSSSREMDVDALAPALLAFGRLIREANSEINGKGVKSTVYVVSDFKHKCFNIDFEAVLSIGKKITSLFSSENVKTAKDVLEMVGLAKTTVGKTTSFLEYLKLKRGRTVEKAESIEDKDGTGLVSVSLQGDSNHVVVHNHVYKLSQNPKALKATRDAFAPIGEDGFRTVHVRENGEDVGTFDTPETEAIIASCNAQLALEHEPLPDNVVDTPAWLSVYSPVYDASAAMWRFKLGREVVYVDISETKIAEDALLRGGALAEDAYHVRLEVTTPVDKDGKEGKPSYKVLQVIKFIPSRPSTQTSLFE